MHSMHSGKLKVGGRKCAALLMGCKLGLPEATPNGVQGVGGSNPLAPTKKERDERVELEADPLIFWVVKRFDDGKVLV
jgi:hypothetical protein